MNEKQLIALAKKNAAKAIASDKKPRPTYDPTLDATKTIRPEDDAAEEATKLFKEMKKREF